jgi:thiol-disulfide isomerase/thioredoxin
MIIQNKKLSIIRRFDHEFLLWKNFMQTYIDQSFDLNSCYLIETKLRQLHRRFNYSFIKKLYNLLKRFDHEVKKSVLKKLTKFCTFCQKHEKSSERFKFILRDDVNMNFNYSVIVNVMYIENNLILHVIDEATRFQAAKWLQNISAKHIWEILRLCWIDVYLNSSDHILHDADKNFVSKKFRQFVISMTIIIKIVSIEAHWSIDIVERYHAELRRAYQMIFENIKIDIDKKIMLQMIVKTINNTADFDELMSTLLVFEVYSRMHVMNSSISSINQRVMTIEKAMIEMRKFRVERQIADALNTRNDFIIISIHDLFFNSNVLI